MQISKLLTQNILSNYSWDYREVFFESSKSFSILAVNGIFRTPSYATLEWFSLLSRSDGEEYFKYFSDLENLESKAKEFWESFGLTENITQIQLQGSENLELKSIEEIHFEGEEILQILQKIMGQYLTHNPLISWSEVTLSLSKKAFVVGNSDGKFEYGNNFYNTLFLKLVGEKDGKREEIYEKITWDHILDEINEENIKKIFENSLEVLEKQLSGIPSPSGKIDVIIGNEAGGTIIHEAVGHGLEADLQNSSVYKDRIGQKVADERVTIVDNPTTLWERGYYKHDHEGYLGKNTVLIENGVLKSYMHNTKTAQKFWVETNWHGRRENYKYKTLVRMGNTYMLPGTDKKEDLIAQISHGIYVSRMWGGQVNTSTGDFVFKVQNGYLIENGKLTKNVTGATLSGNWPEMLNEIFGICDDLHFFDWGTCGKWQAMPVSDGVPTLWTKLKVSGMA